MKKKRRYYKPKGPKKPRVRNPEYRSRKNAKRRRNRKLLAEGRALPPVMALSKGQYLQTFGALDTYDAYADAFIAGAKKMRRRYEFPVEEVEGACFPSHTKRSKCSVSGKS